MELMDLFKLEPSEVLPITKSAIIDNSNLLAEEESTNNMPTYNVDYTVREKWVELGVLNLYDLIQKNK